MSTLTQRVSGMVGIMLLASVCGALAGYWWGRDFTLRHMLDRLDQYAERVRAEGESSTAEARAVLDTLNASADPYCSDAEIAHFRKLIYDSEYLKDGGRIRNGRIDCTAMLGRVTGAGANAGEGVARADGTRFYPDIGLFHISGQTAVSVAKGSALVVYSPFNLKVLQASGMHYTVSARDAGTGQTRRLVGERPGTANAILTTEGTARIGNTLYATRCSARFASCMTAYAPVDEALQAESSQLKAYAWLSALCGALLGFAGYVAYRRSQSLEQQLRRAIRRGAIELVYQPIVDLETGRIVAAEALARWTDENERDVNPEIFIRLAEARGFVNEITKLVVGRAVQDLTWIQRSHPEFRVYVNIAPQDLGDPAFLPMLEQAIGSAGVPAQSLGIEITEGAAANSEAAKETIRRLRRGGHSVHIDDFGTGYSSLAYLHDLSVDGLKIDKAFTRAIGTESVQLFILPQILSMVASLELDVIVEGIETGEQAQYFRANPLPIQGQGWFLGRPMRMDLFLRALAENAEAVAAATVQPR
jgi:sensor c-di-GMP phosphodiesterase-like protein